MRKKPTQPNLLNDVPRKWLEEFAELMEQKGTCPRWVEVMSFLNSNPVKRTGGEKT